MENSCKFAERLISIASKLYGSESVMLKIILNISKLLHKVVLGEIVWFRQFLEKLGMDKVSNRFHILFALISITIF